MNMSLFWRAVAAGLGVAVAQKYIADALPPEWLTAGGGVVGSYGVPIVGAAGGLLVESMLRK